MAARDRPAGVSAPSSLDSVVLAQWRRPGACLAFASGVTLIRESPRSRYTRNTHPQKAVTMRHVLSRPPARATASAWRHDTAPPFAGHR
ncbi:hypothetical protein DIE14_25595 [Burkholderia sp. Bp9017]|nr:hypothetical protein DIE14_25595 [Burkholderia sp. Bp9017]RQZ31147.1 hypothetical protein DIE13_24160 [Burkholderia sp. Bp9016]